jgi:hypothetical protein
MSSSTIAHPRDGRLVPSAPARGRFLAFGAALSLACACDIDDRKLENGSLGLSRGDAGDAGADAGDGGPERGDGLEPKDAAPPTTPEDDPAEPRPIRALGDAQLTGLVGGMTGTDDRARCVEGVLVGFNYAFNDGAHPQFPSRLTFMVPVCAAPRVAGESLDLGEPAPLAWSVVGGDDASVTRPATTRSVLCPQGYAVVGLTGSMDEVQAEPQLFAVRELEIDCAPLFVRDGRIDLARGPVASVSVERFAAASGVSRVEVTCGEGTTAATGAVVRWGSWLDGVGLQCSRLAWPFTAGRGCALDEDCQSGVCESFATCAP